MSDELRTKAEALGVKIDGRWSDERLAQEIAAAEVKGGQATPSVAATQETLVPVKIFYDFWDERGERRPAGQIVEMALSQAKALIAAGKAERADPMPGE